MTDIQKKNIHSNFLGIEEMRNLLRNLHQKFDNEISNILAHSVVGKWDDATLRANCAKAQALKEVIEYVEKEPNCIAR